VVAVDRDQTHLTEVVKEMRAEHVLAHVADVSDSDAADGMVAATLKRFGRLDVLVNNGGIHEGANRKI